MSYRNPGLIRDRTAEVYTQASKDLTNIFIKGIEAKGARLAAEADKKQKDDERWNLNANRNSRVINKLNKKTGDIINTIDGNIFDSFQGNTETLGGLALTAITDNDTQTELSIEQRQANDAIYTKYETYNTTSQTLMGLFKAELNEHYGEKDGDGGLSSSDYGKEWNYVGRNDGERVGNMFIVNSLNNTDAASNYGGTMSKSGGYDEKGNSNATFTTKIPSDNKEFLDFMPSFVRGKMDDKEWKLHKEKNGIEEEVDSETGKTSFVFERTINDKNFGEGFVRKTMAGPSAEDMLIKPGLIDSRGIVPNEAFITDKLNARVVSISGEKGGRATTKSNTKRFFDNSFYVGEGAKNYQVAVSKAKGIIGNNDTDYINDYLKNRLDVINPEDVMNEGVYDPKLIAEAMQIKTQRDGLSKYSNKNAEPEDVAYYKSQGIDITEGERIYYEESNPSEVYNKTEKTYTPTAISNSNKVNNNWNKSKPVLKKIFNSFTGGGEKVPPVKTVMANFAQANISAIPIYGENNDLIGYELKNQLVTTKPSTILLGESKESIDQAIKVASGLSFAIETEWESLGEKPLDFKM
tara:strand:+ start:716 stop:2452 length:1737 start_codon:yes stop_codon:yes gene_type:complete